MKNKKEVEKVAIVKCKNYSQKEVDKAVRKALGLLEFDINKYKKILIKPNVLGYYKENLGAIITHHSIVKSLLKIFKNAKVGESSFTDTENNLRKTGYWQLTPKPLVLEEQKLVKVKDDKAKILRHFYLPNIVREADLIINVPKLKTHTLTKITGAIKNLYGCIPGGVKQVYHRDAEDEKKFSNLLVDIYQSIKPELNIMDAVIGMEGEGPSAGNPKHVGLILASRNAVALDVVAAKLIGFKPKNILMIEEAIKRNLGSYNIKIVGDFREIPNLKFEKPSRFRRAMIKTILLGMTKEKIIVIEDKCVRCGICARKCPVKAITLKPYPIIDEKKCIRCFCCIEVCPHHALHLKDNTLRKVAKIVKEMRKRQ